MVLPIAILTIAVCGKVGSKVQEQPLHDMKKGEEEPQDGTDGAELDEAVSKGTMFINAALLIVLCIVRKSSKDL